MRLITLNENLTVDLIVNTDAVPSYKVTGEEIEISKEQWDAFYELEDSWTKWIYWKGEWKAQDDVEYVKTTWVEQRAKAYGPLDEQLEFIADHGIDEWRAHIHKIKEMYIKAEKPGPYRDDDEMYQD